MSSAPFWPARTLERQVDIYTSRPRRPLFSLVNHLGPNHELFIRSSHLAFLPSPNFLPLSHLQCVHRLLPVYYFGDIPLAIGSDISIFLCKIIEPLPSHIDTLFSSPSSIVGKNLCGAAPSTPACARRFHMRANIIWRKIAADGDLPTRGYDQPFQIRRPCCKPCYTLCILLGIRRRLLCLLVGIRWRFLCLLRGIWRRLSRLLLGIRRRLLCFLLGIRWRLPCLLLRIRWCLPCLFLPIRWRFSYFSCLRSCDAGCCSSSSSCTLTCRAPLHPTGSSSPGFMSRSSSPTSSLPVLPGPSIHCTACRFALTCKHASQDPHWPALVIYIAWTIFCFNSSLGCASTMCTSTIFAATVSAASRLGLRLTSTQGPHWLVASILIIASAVFAANPSAPSWLGVRLTPVAENNPLRGQTLKTSDSSPGNPRQPSFCSRRAVYLIAPLRYGWIAGSMKVLVHTRRKSSSLAWP